MLLLQDYMSLNFKNIPKMRSKLFFLCIAFMAMSHSLTTNAQTKGKLVKKSVVPENKEVSGVAQNAVQWRSIRTIIISIVSGRV